MQVKEVIKTWATDEGHAAKSQITGPAFGKIIGLTIPISEVTADPTVAITFRDGDNCIIIPDTSFTALADGTKHIFFALSNKGTPDATFNPAPVMGPITVSIDPSADPGGVLQTLTVKVRIFIEDSH